MTTPTTTLHAVDGDAQIGQPIDLSNPHAEALLAAIEYRARAGMLVVDSTVTGDLLDLVIFHGCRHEPPMTLRDVLADACHTAIIETLACYADRVADAVRTARDD